MGGNHSITQMLGKNSLSPENPRTGGEAESLSKAGGKKQRGKDSIIKGGTSDCSWEPHNINSRAKKSSGRGSGDEHKSQEGGNGRLGTAEQLRSVFFETIDRDDGVGEDRSRLR